LPAGADRFTFDIVRTRATLIGMPVPTTARGVTGALGRMARPAGSFDAARYFRGDHGLRFYNTGTASVRALARSIHLARRDTWTVDDAMRLADALMADPYLEAKAVGIELVARHRREFSPRLLPRWKRWLARDQSANWATTDLICGTLIGPLLARHPDLITQMRAWARHRNMWVRRAAAVSLIPPMRAGLGVDAAYDVARMLRPDPDDLIQKAVGWMLREAGKQDAARLERYLRAEGAGMPRLTVRYAIERFPPKTRKALLAATRP
jgi:3-methyladenine DNA glycosylase AlkD